MPEPPIAPEVQDYLRSLVREIAGALQDVLGPDDAEAFISIAAQRVAETMTPSKTVAPGAIGAALVQVESEMGGDFYVVEESPAAIVLGNRICPFGVKVLDRTALCMTTSNILGNVTAKHLGYARIEIEKAIAGGATECRVLIHLTPLPASVPPKGREYFASAQSA